jgi:hypothetical protein
MLDPFAEAIENNVTPPVVEEPTTPAKEPRMETSDNSGISVTFKFEGNYSSPWVVIHAADAAEALGVTRDPSFKELMDRTKLLADVYLSPSDKPDAPQAAPKARQGAPAAGQRRPAGPPPGVEMEYCEHGKRNFVSKGTWSAQFCSAPQNTPDDQKCEALWLQKDGTFAAR